MAITSEQREARRKMIGSSDSAAVLGLDPYRSASDVYLEKTADVADFAGNDATDRGIYLEPVLLDFAERELGIPLQRDVMLVHPSKLLCANLDARHVESKAIVEAKSSVNSDEWGAAGSDEVPERVIVQVHHQMAVAGPEYRLAWVPVLLPGYKSLDFRIYRVDRNDDLAKAVEVAGIDFMHRYVLAGQQPDDFKPSLEVLKRVRREPNKTIDVSDSLIDELIVAKAAKKQACEDCEEAEAALIAALGDAEAGRYSRGIATYMETKRKGYTVGECAFRSLKIKADKAASGRKQLAAAEG